MRRALAIAFLGTLLSGSALAGCAAPEETTTAAPKAEIAAGAKDEAIAKLLPADIQQAGKVRVASGVSFPPMEFFDTDNKTVIGFDADLGKALGELLGVEFAFENVNFDGIIGGLNAGRYDLGLTSMIDKEERREQVDFVDYLKSGSALMVPKGNPQSVKEILDMCGKKVAVEKASTGDLYVDDVTKKCADAGKPAVEKVPFPDQASAVQALQSKRADMVLALDLTLAYNVKQAPQQFEVAVSAIDPLPIGIPVPKSKPQLRDAVQAALKKLIADGTYDELLAKWNLQAQAFKDATINAGS
ncbi:ABC transporter substrate-binding protein [Nonomuraea basaltis]|uniref:ABC transporter substrate-binding protein n=1 Tax=Nonomuraea basaltis TaxID=2495887 RepID=UPI00110C5CF2|nr:ABC transporter substrate-binding protein [Nonomuraea basaltis]TMR96322.1 ABC transporter substrate-binding protein [Nonomuraea basaltis]